ncbi:MAG: zinc metalloprotease HtpX [Deltaproteobacteria bacterium]|nr:zinc metalloprotease HtpX [Deltaproteobacteria bacterium]MDA8305477.1 zinc metalloprotease HtpX [Deltaproteobacteria bacterium]
MASKIKTTLLLAVLTGVVIWIGGAVGGQGGMLVAFVLAIIMNAGSYWFSDRIVLAMYHAQPVEESENPKLFQIVRELAAEADLPMPRVYVIPQETPNAFATGRNPEHAAVAVTEGILRILTPSELKGVLGHELGHVRNRDILISSIAATLAGAIMILASMARWAAIFGGFGGRDDREGGILGLLLTAILAPIAAMLIQLAISRSREYLADQTGARLSHNPEGLARALEKLEAASTRVPMDASPATAHMFIVNPLSGKTLAGLFSTHPPIEERIRRLRSMR